MLYIMRRTQLYLDEPLWKALHALARSQKTTVSELVRQAVRDRYLSSHDQRRKAMEQFVGSRPASPNDPDSTAEIRSLRRGTRLERLSQL
jgi:metal-responsive CopG/Arc/MetJ family transcriptional regulator